MKTDFLKIMYIFKDIIRHGNPRIEKPWSRWALCVSLVYKWDDKVSNTCQYVDHIDPPSKILNLWSWICQNIWHCETWFSIAHQFLRCHHQWRFKTYDGPFPGLINKIFVCKFCFAKILYKNCQMLPTGQRFVPPVVTKPSSSDSKMFQSSFQLVPKIFSSSA